MASLSENPEALYGDVIMEHYRSPRHRARLERPDAETEEFNPFCGDRANLQLKLDGPAGSPPLIVGVSAFAEGCSIIQASASLLADGVHGRTVDEAADLSQLFRDLMQGKPLPPVALAELGELEALEVVRQYPVRIKCALLPWVALEEGLRRLR
ncbi:MAG: SUF system NifU family Fe-S cluster assembly protein [Chloroflexi bacterium]|nr:SUF system NifU family Fe-S cluster assembly protein [Chloroflexota bacterium]MYD47370.1 SUF system NifU family Fe-S cluster assembly protein [Chloroflexota bacterium]